MQNVQISTIRGRRKKCTLKKILNKKVLIHIFKVKLEARLLRSP